MRPPVPALEMSTGQREVLESLARSQSGVHREVVRAKALLMAADGVATTAIAASLSLSPSSVKSWRGRFAEERLPKLGQVRKSRGRKPSIPQSKIDEIIDLTQNYRPSRETHCSCPTIAAASCCLSRRCSCCLILFYSNRISCRRSNCPMTRFRVETCRCRLAVHVPSLKGDLVMRLLEVLRAVILPHSVVAAYFNLFETMTHYYKLHFTTTLFAALYCDPHGDLQCMPRHRHQ